MKLTTFNLFLIPLLVLFSPLSNAETVTIPGHMESDTRIDLPLRGSSMDTTREKYGNPNRERLPVGNPPITQWEYDTFNVFFEHQHVIHSINMQTLIMPN